MCDLGKGDLMQALFTAGPYRSGGIYVIESVGFTTNTACSWCQENWPWLRFEGVPVVSPGANGACSRPSHFRKLSGPPPEALIKETVLDNPYPAPARHTIPIKVAGS
jgi:hypothetical protein